MSSTDGRERLSLGLKAMRVLGIVPPGGPAHESGAEAGRVPKRPEGPLTFSWGAADSNRHRAPKGASAASYTTPQTLG